jgi:hypothetical protein
MDESKFPFFNLVAKPYHIPNELAQALAGIVIDWGNLENAINNDLQEFRAFDVVRRLSDDVPGAFGAKVKLWRRAYFALYPTMTVYHRRVEDLFAKTRIVGLERHRIIHGWWRADEDDLGAFYIGSSRKKVGERRGNMSK